MAITTNTREVMGSFDAWEARFAGAALQALDKSGDEAADYARSETSKLAPPVGSRVVQRKHGEATYVPPRGRREGPRLTHPGGWADDSGNLALSLKARAEQVGPAQFAVEFTALGYALFLERNGYWVLSGLFEGFFQDLLRENLKASFGRGRKAAPDKSE